MTPQSLCHSQYQDLPVLLQVMKSAHPGNYEYQLERFLSLVLLAVHTVAFTLLTL